MKCANCGFDNDTDAGFCENCGEALNQVCSNCGSALKPRARFCKKCGTAVARPAAASQAGGVTEDERRDRLAALQRSVPQGLQDKILAARDQLEGERKPVTILFTDIVGSTAVAEKLDPEEWKEIVNGAHRRVSVAVYRYEGTVAQLLGDGVLAFFGAPVTHEDDPLRAVHAGLDIQQSIEEYSRQLQGYIDNFQLRVGIHSGTVVVGQVGSDLHMEYLAIGDAVNLAARLQSSARPGKVLLSAATARLVSSAFDLEDLGEISLKGKADPVKVFEVAGRKAVPWSGRRIEGLVSPIVGRDQELVTLRQALKEVSSGHGHIVAILGEAGIGKSRLVDEARLLSNQPEKMNWLEGRALSYGQTLSFWTVIQLLKNDLGLADADPEAKSIVALRKRVKALFGERESEIMPYLAHLIGVKLDGEMTKRVRVFDGETLKRQVLYSIGEYFNRTALEQPTVLVFEDLHWADPSTLEALEKLLALTDRAPLLILLVARTERDHGSWKIKVKAETEYAHRFTEISLKAMSADDANQLVNNLLEVVNLPDETRRLILERSEGNPFYLEEIIRSLIEQGALVQEDSGWRAAGEFSQVAIPATLQGVLLARIDRLQEDVRRTLQLASVIGRTFLYRLLEAISEAGQQLDGHLAQLQRADLVREKMRWPELEYMFKHSLTQEAAYSSLLIERRAAFHREVGEALEQLFADRQEEFFGLLAHHFDVAGESARAISYWIKAGDKSRLEDALDEAIQSYQRAIALLDQVGDTEQAVKTWLKLGLCYQTNFEFEQAHQAYEAAFALEQEFRANHPYSQGEGTRPEQPHRLRTCFYGSPIYTIDPGVTQMYKDVWVTKHVFAGLAELDCETNVVPHAARSWEVLDDGTRYLFHLRDDVRWTDGTPITAQDFAWTWKHNLARCTTSYPGSLLDDIVGARDFREGKVSDPDSVGIKALDPLTLEVRLVTPVAHFIYLVALSFTYPLPRVVLERYGENWWRPEHILSNGAFRLLEFNQGHILLARNPDYFGEFPGNLDQYEDNQLDSKSAVLHAYQNGLADILESIDLRDIPAGVPSTEHEESRGLSTGALILNPTEPPLDDVRIRRAIAHALDRAKWYKVTSGSRLVWHGGEIIPPGIAGHSPELGLGFDLERAQQYLAEAGYLRGRNLGPLKWYYPLFLNQANREEFKRQLSDPLGIQVEMVPMSWEVPWENYKGFHIQTVLYMADYPDAENCLRQCYYPTLRNQGWRHPRFELLVEQAVRTPNRARRLALYREADRILVDEEVVVIPLIYVNYRRNLLKPWIKGLKLNATGEWSLKDITIEPH